MHFCLVPPKWGHPDCRHQSRVPEEWYPFLLLVFVKFGISSLSENSTSSRRISSAVRIFLATVLGDMGAFAGTTEAVAGAVSSGFFLRD